MNQIPWKSLTQKMIELKIFYDVNKKVLNVYQNSLRKWQTKVRKNALPE